VPGDAQREGVEVGHRLSVSRAPIRGGASTSLAPGAIGCLSGWLEVHRASASKILGAIDRNVRILIPRVDADICHGQWVRTPTIGELDRDEAPWSSKHHELGARERRDRRVGRVRGRDFRSRRAHMDALGGGDRGLVHVDSADFTATCTAATMLGVGDAEGLALDIGLAPDAGANDAVALGVEPPPGVHPATASAAAAATVTMLAVTLMGASVCGVLPSRRADSG